MSFWTLDLTNTRITRMHYRDDHWVVDFDGILTKTMEGAIERTQWKQSGTLQISTLCADLACPQLPAKLKGGEVTDNIYVYRNNIRIPLNSRGDIHLQLNWQSGFDSFCVHGDKIDIVMHNTPKYIDHVR